MMLLLFGQAMNPSEGGRAFSEPGVVMIQVAPLHSQESSELSSSQSNEDVAHDCFSKVSSHKKMLSGAAMAVILLTVFTTAAVKISYDNNSKNGRTNSLLSER